MYTYRAPNLGCRFVGVKSAVNLFPENGECKVAKIQSTLTCIFLVFEFEEKNSFAQNAITSK